MDLPEIAKWAQKNTFTYQPRTIGEIESDLGVTDVSQLPDSVRGVLPLSGKEIRLSALRAGEMVVETGPAAYDSLVMSTTLHRGAPADWMIIGPRADRETHRKNFYDFHKNVTEIHTDDGFFEEFTVLVEGNNQQFMTDILTVEVRQYIVANFSSYMLDSTRALETVSVVTHAKEARFSIDYIDASTKVFDQWLVMLGKQYSTSPAIKRSWMVGRLREWGIVVGLVAAVIIAERVYHFDTQVLFSVLTVVLLLYAVSLKFRLGK